MIDPAALQLAAELGGTLLSAPSGSLLLVERLQGHGLPQVALLGQGAADLREPLEAAARVQARGLGLNLLALVPLGCELAPAFELHRRRLGALVAALDAGLPWLDGRPMLARRLPGRIFSPVPLPLPKAPMGPLEKAELKAFLPAWDKARRREAFRRPEWRPVAGGFEAPLWPGVPVPEGAELRVRPLELPCATPLSEALRGALRTATGAPVPLLPLPEDPSALQALRGLSPDVAAFRGPLGAWEEAFTRLAQLPAPAHFCGRC